MSTQQSDESFAAKLSATSLAKAAEVYNWHEPVTKINVVAAKLVVPDTAAIAADDQAARLADLRKTKQDHVVMLVVGAIITIVGGVLHAQHALPTVANLCMAVGVVLQLSAVVVIGQTHMEIKHLGEGGANPRAWLDSGRVVALNERCLARFQSLPDWYELPEQKSLACKLIGNMWPALMAQRVYESLCQK